MRSVPPAARSIPPPGSGRSIPPGSRKSFDLVRLNVAAVAERAVVAAARRARRYGLTEATFRDLIVRVDARTETYERLLTTIERREVFVEYEAGHGARTSEAKAPLDPSRVDPWTVERSTLRDRSRRVVLCDACSGSTAQTCRKCGGEGALPCPYCRGSRQVNGKSCEGCTGVGSVTCGSCARGTIQCPTCAGQGVRYSWLRLDARVTHVVTVEGDEAAILAHEAVKTPSDFDADPKRWKNEMFYDTGARETDDEIPPQLIPEVDPDRERIRSLRLQSFASSVHGVVVQTMLGRSLFQVAGVPPEVLSSSKVAMLRLYRTLLLLFASGGVWLSIMAKIGHERPHPWFSQHGVGLPLFFCLLMASGAGVYAVSVLLLSTSAWRVKRLAPAFAVMAVFGGAASQLPRLARPSVPSADAALAEKRVAAARAEAEAVIATGGDIAGAQRVLDEITKADLLASSLEVSMHRLPSTTFHSSSTQAEVAANVRARLVEEQKRLLAANDASALFKLGDGSRAFDAELARTMFAAGAELEVSRCASEGRVPCEFRGGELPDAQRSALERRLEVAYAQRNVSLGEWDALGKRLERWSKQPALAPEIAAMQASATVELERRMANLLGAEAKMTDPRALHDLADKELAIARMLVRLGGKEPPPGIPAFVKKVQTTEQAVERAEREATKQRGATWR